MAVACFSLENMAVVSIKLSQLFIVMLLAQEQNPLW